MLPAIAVACISLCPGVARAQGPITLVAGATPYVLVAPGAKLAVPIALEMSAASAGTNIASLASFASWGGSRLTLDSIKAGTFGTVAATVSPGSAALTLSSNVGTPTAATIAILHFTAGSSLGGTRIVATASTAIAQDGASILSRVRSRGIDVCIAATGKWGDPTGDNAVNIIDAQQIARYSVALSVGNITGVVNQGDVNDDAVVNVIDAQQIARYSVGLASSARINTTLLVLPSVASISIASSSNSVNVGRTRSLTSTALDATSSALGGCAPTTWTTSDASVATVNETGTVTGIAAGNAIITASAGGRTASTTVSVFAPDRLQFSVQPTSQLAGVALAPTVQVSVVSSTGEIRTGSAVNVSLSLGSTTPGPVLAGTLTKPTAGGIATFNDLAVDRSVTGAVLVARASGFDSLVSNEVNIVAPPVLVDSTVLRLTSDAAARAAGSFVFQAATSAPTTVRVGQVLVGAEKGGYLVKVTGLTQTGSVITATTTPASLTDIVKDGDIDETISFDNSPRADPATHSQSGARVRLLRLDPPRIASALQGVTIDENNVIHLSDVVLLDDGTNRITVNTGTMRATPVLTLRTRIRDFKLTSAEVRAGGSFVFSGDFAVKTRLLTIQPKKEFIILQQSGILLIGEIPVPFTSEVPIEVGLKLTLSTPSSLVWPLNVGGGGEFVAQAQYDGTRWTGNVAGSTYVPVPTVASPIVDFEAKARLYLGAAIKVTLAGTVSTGVKVEPFVEAKAEIDPLAETLTTSCESGIDFTSNIDLKVAWFNVPLYSDAVTALKTTFPQCASQRPLLPPTTFVVSQESLALTVQDTAVLTAVSKDADGAILPARHTTWTSSNPLVATVSALGTVHAVAPGTATITAAITGRTATSLVTVAAPVVVVGSSLVAGYQGTCGLSPAGIAYCWGTIPVGDGTAGPAKNTPTLVSLDLQFGALAPMGNSICGLTRGGDAYCWGLNITGQLGDGTMEDHFTPSKVVGGLKFSSIAGAGVLYYGHVCGLTPAGQAYCWGENWDPTVLNSWLPRLNAQDLTFKLLVAGREHVCGLTSTGAVYCWGYGHQGQTGNGTKWTGWTPPTQVSGSLIFTAIFAGGQGTCGLTTTGATYCWGDNQAGNLGDAATAGKDHYEGIVAIPTQVLAGYSFVTLALSEAHSCGLTSTGKAYCWGSNFYGNLGNGTSDWASYTPVPVSGDHTFVSLTSGSEGHQCALDTAGKAFCWGSNQFGQLGDGTFIDRNVPTPVKGSLTFKVP